MKKKIALILMQFFFMNVHAMMSDEHDEDVTLASKNVHYVTKMPVNFIDMFVIKESGKLIRGLAITAHSDPSEIHDSTITDTDISSTDQIYISTNQGSLYKTFNLSVSPNFLHPVLLPKKVSEKSSHRNCKHELPKTNLQIETPIGDLSDMNIQNIMRRIIRNCVNLKGIIEKSMPSDRKKDCTLGLMLNSNTRYNIDIPYNIVEMFAEMKIDHDTNTDSSEFDRLRFYADDVFAAYKKISETAER